MDKQAENPVLIDLRGMSAFTDFFLVLSAASVPQLKAVAEAIRDSLRDNHGIRPMSMEGSPESQWIVIDYSGVTIHLFLDALRDRYALEDLWNDAPLLPLDP